VLFTARFVFLFFFFFFFFFFFLNEKTANNDGFVQVLFPRRKGVRKEQNLIGKKIRCSHIWIFVPMKRATPIFGLFFSGDPFFSAEIG